MILDAMLRRLVPGEENRSDTVGKDSVNIDRCEKDMQELFMKERGPPRELSARLAWLII